MMNRLADLIVKILFTSATHEKQNTLKTARQEANPTDTRIVNPRSASNRKTTQENFSTLPQRNNYGKMNPATWEETKWQD
jgi:hypothetical protein